MSPVYAVKSSKIPRFVHKSNSLMTKRLFCFWWTVWTLVALKTAINYRTNHKLVYTNSTYVICVPFQWAVWFSATCHNQHQTCQLQCCQQNAKITTVTDSVISWHYIRRYICVEDCVRQPVHVQSGFVYVHGQPDESRHLIPVCCDAEWGFRTLAAMYCFAYQLVSSTMRSTMFSVRYNSKYLTAVAVSGSLLLMVNLEP